jgi:hypothetical protein
MAFAFCKNSLRTAAITASSLAAILLIGASEGK